MKIRRGWAVETRAAERTAGMAALMLLLALFAGCGHGSQSTTPVPSASGPGNVNGGAGNPSTAPQFVIASGPGNDAIAVWQIEPTTGALTNAPNTPFVTTGRGPAGLAVHPNGKFLYGANATSQGIAAYNIDPANGRLTPDGGEFTTGIGGSPVRAMLDAAGTHAYIASASEADVAVYDVNPGTGMITPLTAQPPPDSTRQTADLAVVPPMVYLSYANGIWGDRLNSNGSVNPGTGMAQTAAPLNRMAVTSDGKFLYAATSAATVLGHPGDSGHLYAFQTHADGTLTPTGNTPLALAGVVDIVVTGGLLLASSPAGVTVFSISPASGTLTLLNSRAVPGTGTVGALNVDLSGRFVYVVIGNQVTGFSIGTNGVLEVLPTAPFPAPGVDAIFTLVVARAP